MRVAVISSISEPVPGWMDNFHGPVGLLAAAGKGLVHIALADQSVVADYMPVDIAIKAVIVAAWERATAAPRAPGPGPTPAVPIYNCSSAAVKPVPMSKMVAMARPLAAEIPFDDVLWPTYALTTSSRVVLLFGTLLLHMVPALVIDTVLRLQGRKPRSVQGASSLLSGREGAVKDPSSTTASDIMLCSLQNRDEQMPAICVPPAASAGVP